MYLFVYGTLKRGFVNHHLMPPTTFIGDAVTASAIPLVIAGQWFSPVLIDEQGGGVRVEGELHRIDADSLEMLDRLEGVGTATGYDRREIDVEHGDRTLVASVYVKPWSRCTVVHSRALSRYAADDVYVPAHERHA
ncbi:MAG: gamma-glutamylcyclotransferase [Actinomycetia bacterium]|nr:gamma-glutamylcyclotransferase [Actinomycetes bacterium]